MDQLQQLTKKLKGRNFSLLIADDDEITRLVLNKFCSSIGCRLHFASTGLEALDMLHTKDIDIAFLDLQMPKLSGFEVLEQYQTTTKSDLKEQFVVISSSSTQENKDRAKLLGFDFYLPKPISAEQFFETILTCLNGKNIDPIELYEPVDFNSLQELLGDEAIVKSVIKNIKEELPKHLQKAEPKDFFNDINKSKDFIHKIRPSFSYLGMKKKAALLLNFEIELSKGLKPANLETSCRKIIDSAYLALESFE